MPLPLRATCTTLLAAAVLASAMLAGMARADPLDQRSARKMLFSPKGLSVELVEDGGLTPTQLGYFRIMVESGEYRKQLERVARYYGAIAISPSVFEGPPAALLADPESIPFQMVGGMHGPDAAQSRALAACNRLLRPGDAPCALAARILPRRYKPRDLTLSYAATAAFKEYRKAPGPKAFAISRGSAAFGLADGDNAWDEAVALCNAKLEPAMERDCEVVIAD